jgi:hypothetical protein
MPANVFALIGVDYRQWKAVSRTLLRTDFRPMTPQSGETYSLGTVGGVLKMALTFGIFGLVTAFVVAFNPDVLLTGIITLTYFTFALVTALLTQHGATVFSLADHVILGPRPVSSRTLFAIRVTNVLFHTLLTTTFMAYPAIIAFTVAHGVNPWRGFAATAAIYSWTATVAFAVVAVYGWVLHVVGAARLQRTLGYVQLLIGVFAYGGFFLASETFNRRALQRFRLPETSWLFLYPPAWFASLLEVATGEITAQSIARVAMAMTTFAGAFMLLRGRLAAGYAERVAELAASAPPRAAVERARQPWWFANGEARAVAILVRAHFRHDLRVRMGVLGVVPLMLIYVVQGMRSGGNPDPFLPESADRAVDILALAVLMFPAIVTRQLESSEAYRAAWIYSVTAASRVRLISALKNVATAYFLIPFAVLLAALFAWRFGHLGHALTHAALLAAVSHLALQVAMLLSPKLPFAHPPDKKADSTAMFVWMFAVLIGGQLLVFAIQRFVYPSWGRIAVLALGLASSTWLLEWAIRRRTGSKASRPV